MDIISDQDFIGVGSGKWEDNSKFIDWASGKPSNTFSLYRYDMKTKQIRKLEALSSDELNRWYQ
ncbi:hypothetical protein [Paenibacillus sediminis]|uniref:Uncharacterized protein n=1 Tax=Paenibacillus sediminis TaxID=664909 RepID=A0ABS4H0I9_9BACL|nr:hypothetical protein [Paenibacillus sediminis]MBP1936039.1 hypothetical protein [Paenibacillus sediminis]